MRAPHRPGPVTYDEAFDAVTVRTASGKTGWEQSLAGCAS